MAGTRTTKTQQKKLENAIIRDLDKNRENSIFWNHLNKLWPLSTRAIQENKEA